ncbi:MAG: hypothetical protein ACRCU2_11960 [Planktothrix sp.]
MKPEATQFLKDAIATFITMNPGNGIETTTSRSDALSLPGFHYNESRQRD